MLSSSVTGWIRALKAGEREVVGQLWERYARRLLCLARRVLHTSPGRIADEEDVALSAFDSFCRQVERGRLPQLTNRDELWRVLSVITSRKAIDQLHYDRRRQTRRFEWDAGDPTLDELPAADLAPDAVVAVAEQMERLFNLLPQPELRTIVLCKLDGCTNGEIADRLDCTRRTIERKLLLVRKIWSQELER